MGRITRRPQAEDDLVDIWLFIARDDPAAADRVLGDIEGTLERLREYPRSGRARPELMPELRSVTVRSYVLFHLPLADGVDLGRVLHDARDVDATLFND